MAKVTEIVKVAKPPNCGLRKPPDISESRTISLLSIDLDDDPFSLPIKNATNAALDREVSDKERKILRGKAQLADLEVRIAQLWEKLKSVRYEVQQNQSILAAKDGEYESEKLMLKMLATDFERTKVEIRKMEMEITELDAKKAKYEAQLKKEQKEVEVARGGTKYNQEEFQKYLNSMLEMDDMNINIQKFILKDDATLTSMNAHLEKLHEEHEVKKRQLDHLNTELKSVQLQLDKANTEYKESHSVRQNLIDQWHKILELMKTRDEEMEQLSMQLSEVRELTNGKSEALKDAQEELKTEESVRVEILRNIRVQDKLLARLQSELHTLELKKQSLMEDVHVSKISLNSTKSTYTAVLKQLELLKIEVSTQEQRMSDLKSRKEERKSYFVTVKEEGKGVASLETMINTEETTLKKLEKQKVSLQDSLAKERDKVHLSKREEKRLTDDIEGLKLMIKNMGSKLKQLEKEEKKRKEMLETQEEQIQSAVKQLEFVEGKSDGSSLNLGTEGEQLKVEIKKAQELLLQRQKSLATYEQSLKRAQLEVSRSTQDAARMTKFKQNLSIKFTELTNITDNLDTTARKVIDQKQGLMVDSNMLKLEVKRLTDTLTAKQEEQTGIEAQSKDISLALKSRQQEISVKRAALLGELNQVDEERRKDLQIFKEHINRVEQIRNKYEIFTLQMRPPEGEKGSIEEYLTSKVSQERNELQTVGDELDYKVRKAEKEILALNNTLRLVIARNAAFRQGNSSQVDKSSDDYQEKIRLESQYQLLQNDYRDRRRLIKTLKDDLQSMKTRFEAVENGGPTQQVIEGKQSQMTQLLVELTEQQERIEKEQQLCQMRLTEIKEVRPLKSANLLVKDVDLRTYRSFNEALQKLILESTKTDSHLYKLISAEHMNAGLTPPCVEVEDGAQVNLTRRMSDGNIQRSAKSDRSNTSAVSLKTITLDAEAIDKIAKSTKINGVNNSTRTVTKTTITTTKTGGLSKLRSKLRP